MTPVPTVFTSGETIVIEFSFAFKAVLVAYPPSRDVIPDPVTVPFNVRGPVIVVLVALTS